MSYNFRRVLALSPHTDDIEFGCGGSIGRWVEQRKEIYYVVFSIAEKSVPEGFPKDILEQEAKQATKVIGVAEENLSIHKFEVRKFPQFRQEILEILVSLQKKLNPDLVLLPSLKDIHQDHRTIAEEGVRAFKYTNILSYELPWNNISFMTSSFVILERRHIAAKVEAISCYKSQRSRHYCNEEFIYALAKTRGTQIKAEYAEAFEMVRWVIR